MLHVVAEVLRQRRIAGWLVGGSVRDAELGRYSPDLDIVVKGDPREVARAIARGLDSPWFMLSERHTAYRVMGPRGHVDIAAVRGDGILDDLAERDFTVNAMAMPLGVDDLVGETPAIDRRLLLDPFAGLRHLAEKRLVAVSSRIFDDDPLRMLRAVRFRHVLGLELDGSLEDSIRASVPLLRATAAERISAEVALTLAEGRSDEAVARWDDLGLLPAILPPLPSGYAQAALAPLARLDEILSSPERWFPGGDLLAARRARPVDGALSRPVALRLAALTRCLTPEAATLAGRTLKLSGDVVSLLSTMSRATGTVPFSWPSVRAAGRPGREAVLFLWQAAPWEPEAIVLATAFEDGLTEPPAPVAAADLLGVWMERAGGNQTPLPVDGNELMAYLGVTSGPKLGAILREVRLAWEAGDIASRAELLDLATSCSACES